MSRDAVDLRLVLPRGGPVRVRIVDVSGRVVANLADGVLPPVHISFVGTAD
jgi:hypothetical protein